LKSLTAAGEARIAALVKLAAKGNAAS